MNSLQQITVLIIDDEESIREYLHCILEEAGYQIIEAVNGVQGLEHLATQHIDVIITDLIMPEKEGIETIREIKTTYPECKIIAMSGALNHENYLKITTVLGADAVLPKPIPRDEILGTLRAILTGQ